MRDARTSVSSFIVGVVVTAVLVGGGGAAWAATGKPMLLGGSNKATKTTKVTNAKGTPLTLTAGHGKAPFTVNNSTKVGNLNADKIDGLSSEAFVRSSVKSTFVRAAGVFQDVTSDGIPDILVSVAQCPNGSYLTGGGERNFAWGETLVSEVTDDGDAWAVVAATDVNADVADDLVATAICVNPSGTAHSSFFRTTTKKQVPASLIAEAAAALAKKK